MSILRAILATLALVGQLAFGPVPAQARPAAAASSGLRAAIILCHAPGAPHHRQARDDQAGGRIELALQLPATILTPAILLPRPSLPVATRLLWRPSARAPPGVLATGPRARGPPTWSEPS